MRKFSLFILIFFGVFSLAGELNLVESFRFDGSTFYKKQVVKNESFYFLKNENMDEHFAAFKVKFDKDVKTKNELKELKKALKQDKNVLFSEENDQILALIKDETKSKNDGVMMLSYERIYDPKTLADALKPVLLSEARNFMLQMPKVEAR